MLHDNGKIIIYKLIGAVMYNIIDNCTCLDYLGMLQDKLSKHDNKFENTKFNNLSELGIPDILMNIISCHGFSKSSISTSILKCRSALVPCYPPFKNVIVGEKKGDLDNIPISMKYQPNGDNLHPEDSLLTCRA